MSAVSYQYIKDPSSNKQVHISSPEGIALMKNFVSTLVNSEQVGGKYKYSKLTYKQVQMFLLKENVLYEEMPLGQTIMKKIGRSMLSGTSGSFDSVISSVGLKRIHKPTDRDLVKISKQLEPVGVINVENLKKWWCTPETKNAIVLKNKYLDKFKNDNTLYGVMMLTYVDENEGNPAVRMEGEHKDRLLLVKSPIPLKIAEGKKDFFKKMGKTLGFVKHTLNSKIAQMSEDELSKMLKNKVKVSILTKDRKNIKKKHIQGMKKVYERIGEAYLHDNGLDLFGFHYYVFGVKKATEPTTPSEEQTSMVEGSESNWTEQN